MKAFFVLFVVVSSLAVASEAYADTLELKNGDHLTGTVTGSDGTQITIKTDYAGDIKVKWSAVRELSSEKPLYVVTPDKKTVNGNITLQDNDLIVHTATAGEIHVPLTQVTVVRSAEDQQAYEKSIHPGLLDDWKGGINVGFALARGNSETTNLSTGFTADRKTLSDEVKLYSSSIYTTNGATTNGGPGGVTANEILGGARYDRNITKALFGFGSGDFTHDVLQGLDIRAIFTGGLGWHAINNPKTTFDVIGGLNYTRESYSSGATVATPAGTSVGRNLPGITVGEDFTHKFGSTMVLNEDFQFYPDLSDINQYRFSLDSSFVTKINKWLGWQTSLSDRYVTNPPVPGTKSNDVVLSTGLNISFTH